MGFFQFNSSPQPPGYITYLLSALQALKRGRKRKTTVKCIEIESESLLWHKIELDLGCKITENFSFHLYGCFHGADFRGVVRFGVVTNKQVAEVISLREDETVYLHRRFNSSLVRIITTPQKHSTEKRAHSWLKWSKPWHWHYADFFQIFPRRERNFTSQAICSWVFEHHETVLHWLQPPGVKSRLLEQELTKGPALLLFLPHNPLRPKPGSVLQQVSSICKYVHYLAVCIRCMYEKACQHVKSKSSFTLT